MLFGMLAEWKEADGNSSWVMGLDQEIMHIPLRLLATTGMSEEGVALIRVTPIGVAFKEVPMGVIELEVGGPLPLTTRIDKRAAGKILEI